MNGVRFTPQRREKKWYAYRKVNGRLKNLGWWVTEFQAREAVRRFGELSTPKIAQDAPDGVGGHPALSLRVKSQPQANGGPVSGVSRDQLPRPFSALGEKKRYIAPFGSMSLMLAGVR